MKLNGSPEPIFDTDDERTYFQVTLDVHPDFATSGHITDQSDKLQVGNLSKEERNKENEGASEKGNEGAYAYAKTRGSALEASNANNNIDVKIIVTIIEGAIEGATTRTRDKIARTLKAIIEHEHNRVPEYVKITGYNAKTLERYIRQLREAGLIDFTEGARKPEDTLLLTF